MWWLYILVGLVGVCCGYALCALLVAASDRDSIVDSNSEKIEREED